MSTDTSQVSGLSGRYAVALFDLSKESGALETASEQLKSIQAVVDESDDFRALLRNPLVARDAQVAALTAVLEKAGVSGAVLNFVKTVGANRRLAALPDMIRDFNLLLAAHRGEVAAQVTSAAELDAAEIDSLQSALSKKLGSDVALESRVDPSLLGGVIVQLGSRMYDGSVKTKLQSLKLAMKGVG